jgi:hypothetical protein
MAPDYRLLNLTKWSALVTPCVWEPETADEPALLQCLPMALIRLPRSDVTFTRGVMHICTRAERLDYCVCTSTQPTPPATVYQVHDHITRAWFELAYLAAYYTYSLGSGGHGDDDDDAKVDTQTPEAVLQQGRADGSIDSVQGLAPHTGLARKPLLSIRGRPNRSLCLTQWLKKLVRSGLAHETMVEEIGKYQPYIKYLHWESLVNRIQDATPFAAPQAEEKDAAFYAYYQRVVGYYWSLCGWLNLLLTNSQSCYSRIGGAKTKASRGGGDDDGDGECQDWDLYVMRNWQRLKRLEAWKLQLLIVSSLSDMVQQAEQQYEEEEDSGEDEDGGAGANPMRVHGLGFSVDDPEAVGTVVEEVMTLQATRVPVRDLTWLHLLRANPCLSLAPPRFWNDPQRHWGTATYGTPDRILDPVLCGLLTLTLCAPQYAVTTTSKKLDVGDSARDFKDTLEQHFRALQCETKLPLQLKVNGRAAFRGLSLAKRSLSEATFDITTANVLFMWASFIEDSARVWPLGEAWPATTSSSPVASLAARCPSPPSSPSPVPDPDAAESPPM